MLEGRPGPIGYFLADHVHGDERPFVTVLVSVDVIKLRYLRDGDLVVGELRDVLHGNPVGLDFDRIDRERECLAEGCLQTGNLEQVVVDDEVESGPVASRFLAAR